MKTRRQSGFGLVETILILVLIGLIGFVAWYVYNSKTDTESIYGNTSNTQSVDKYQATHKDWQTVKSPDGSYSFKMPKDWVSLTCENSGGSASAIYIASKNDYLAKCQSDSAGEANFISVADNSAQKAPTKKADDKTFSLTEVTVNKVKGYKAATTTSSEAALLANAKFIVFSFYANGKSYYATYIQLKNMPDDAKTFSQIVQTWNF